MRELPKTSFVSVRAALMSHGSVLAIAGAVAVAATPAFAQQTSPSTPTADPTAKASTESTTVETNPVPNADQSAQPAVPEAGAGETQEPADIVVTGIRASLASSAKIKRDSTLIVDSVSAEDIGKLPDVSIADSLARLPGVTAQRLEGRDQRLSIRGLGPDFSTTLLNGREQVTVGDNRGVEFDQYPSEFFKNVNVYKSADASLIAAGIAGTVDLRMLRPLDQPHRVFVISARGEMNDYKKLNPDGERYGYRASATYVDKFANDTLGVAIGVSATQAPSQDERYNAWGYAGSGTTADPFRLGGAKPYVQSNLLKRYGAVGTLEWEPSDRFHSTFDALYSHFEETQRLRGIEFPLAFNGRPESGAVVADGFVTDETFGDVHAVQRNDVNQRKANDLSLGWNNALQLSDSMRFDVDASWSRAKRTDFLLETYTGAGYGGSGPGDTVRVSQNGDGTYNIVPTLNYADTNIFKITDPQGWGYNGTQPVVQAGFLNRPSFKDDLKSLRADLAGDFNGGVLKDWDVGGNYTRREKTSAYTSYFLCPKGGGTNCTVASGTPTSVPVPADALLGKNVALDYLGVPQMLTLNPFYLYDNIYNAVYDNRPDSLARDNTVTENVYTGYAKINIDGEVGGKVLKGSIGAQVVHTRQGSSGAIASFDSTTGTVTVVPATEHTSYTDFLPSATFSLEVVPAGYIKLGASETMVRPRLDQERVTQAVSVTVGNIGLPAATNPVFTSSGGSVDLRPYKSLNVDISAEKYFTGGGYVSLAGYFKHLTNFVNPSNTIPEDFTALLTGLSPAQQAAILAAGQQIGNNSYPNNNGRGEILGSEATLSLPFKALTSALDGFGIFASGSYNYSSIKYATQSAAITLPGLSKWVASGEAYFEKWGFQARASYRYRSSFLGEVAGLSAAPTYRQVQPEGILDAQIGYEFQGGFLKGLAILAQAKNLTNEPFITYQNGDKRQVIDYQSYGRDYYLGLTYKF